MSAAAACAAPDPLPGYAPASAVERALVVRTVEDYYAMRERAAVSGDLLELYAAYPELARNVDRRQGINNEGFFAELARMAREGPKETAPRPITRMWHRLEISEPIGIRARQRRCRIRPRNGELRVSRQWRAEQRRDLRAVRPAAVR